MIGLAMTVTAFGLPPGPHAAHLHLGTCQQQGGVTYMLMDYVANATGELYPSGDGAVPEMLDLLARQIASPVQFVQGLRPLPRHPWLWTVLLGRGEVRRWKG